MSIQQFRHDMDMQALRVERIVTLVSNGELSAESALFLYPELAEALESSDLFSLRYFSFLHRRRSKAHFLGLPG